jgi:hypothetical protein
MEHFNHETHEPHENGAQGITWQAKLALRFQIPSQASLHGIPKPQRLSRSASGLAAPKSAPRQK